MTDLLNLRDGVGLRARLDRNAGQRAAKLPPVRRRGAVSEDDERVVKLVAFGWPDPSGMVPYSAKKCLDELRRYECGDDA